MKKALMVVLALVMSLVLVIGSFSVVSATPGEQNGDSLSIVQPAGGAYIHVTDISPGDLEFNYGWNNSNHFANPVGSYWIGVYDVDYYPNNYGGRGTYIWCSGWVNCSESKLKLNQTVTGLISGHTIKFVFFVREGANGTGNYLAKFEDGENFNTIIFTAP